MSNDTTKVDVVGAMRKAVGRLRVQHPDQETDSANDVAARALHESIDAIAELIAADRKYDSARKSWEQCKKGGYARYLTASKRRAEALARIAGAA